MVLYPASLSEATRSTMRYLTRFASPEVATIESCLDGVPLEVKEAVKRNNVLIIWDPTISAQDVEIVRARLRAIHPTNRIVICKLPEYDIIKEL